MEASKWGKKLFKKKDADVSQAVTDSVEGQFSDI